MPREKKFVLNLGSRVSKSNISGLSFVEEWVAIRSSCIPHILGVCYYNRVWKKIAGIIRWKKKANGKRKKNVTKPDKQRE